ncbi:MAG TPA: hypothetical protein DCG34_08275 [Clostridiales bacterium]|nr:hypothetical protein [Clostridiales bacterium]
MKRYVLSTHLDNDPNAGTKSRRDIEDIVLKEGYTRLVLRKRFLTGRFKIARQVCILAVDLLRVLVCIERHSILLINVPLPFAKWQTPIVAGYFKFLRSVKQIKIAFSVIDIDSHRRNDKKQEGEWNILRTGSCFILHTKPMKEVFVKQGFDAGKVVLNHLFDYISEFEPHGKHRALTNQVVFAGNLDPDKCGFLSNLNDVGNRVIFNLYGEPAKQYDSSSTVRYMGSASPEEIVGIIDGSFGLVWDGDSIDTCSSAIGEYLRINAPHKTSLYLAAGLPVIIWKEAAMAELIVKENLGFTVGSLREIGAIVDTMTEGTYNQMRDNVLRYAPLLKEGYFFKEALKKVYEMI